jgi:hypothetical protein
MRRIVPRADAMFALRLLHRHVRLAARTRAKCPYYIIYYTGADSSQPPGAVCYTVCGVISR